MLKELLSHRPIQVALVFVILIGISSVLYLNHIKTETESDVANPETSVGRQKTPPVSASDTPDSSTQGRHRHADGTWHAEPHEPVEVSEAESQPPAPADLTPVQGGSSRVAPVNAENATSEQESAQRTQADREAFEKWVAWEDKYSELRKEDSQAGQALIDAMPATEEEAKRYEADENYRREMDQKFQEAVDKIGDVMRRIREHEAKRVLPPGAPTQ